MKTKIILLMTGWFVFILFSLHFNVVQAHPPTNMTGSYDQNTEILTVTIIHPVSDPNKHYIEMVEVRVNDTIVLTEYYTSQPNSNIFTYKYSIVAGDGAYILIEARCNENGGMGISVIVGAPTGLNIPGFTEFFWILGICFFIAIIITIKNRKIFHLSK